MISYIWIVCVMIFRGWMIQRFLVTGDLLPTVFAISESLALASTAYAAIRGKVDSSIQGLLLPVLHLPVLLFDTSAPAGPDWACGFYLLLVPFQILLRLRMGLCCTVAVPCFVRLLDRFPYSHVRHPLAALELVLAFFVAIWLLTPWNIVVFIVAAVCNVICIRIEERFLMSQESYRDYVLRVPWRYVPKLY